MNNHAGWAPEGICVVCGADEPRGTCDPNGMWERLKEARKRIHELEFSLASLLRHEPWPGSDQSERDYTTASKVLAGNGEG